MAIVKRQFARAHVGAIRQRAASSEAVQVYVGAIRQCAASSEAVRVYVGAIRQCAASSVIGLRPMTPSPKGKAMAPRCLCSGGLRAIRESPLRS